MFGAVPIVHTSPITRALLDGLPACFVPAWDALTPDVLKRCDKRLAETRSFDWGRLTVDYWRTQISESKAGQRVSKPPAKADAVERPPVGRRTRRAHRKRKAGRWAALAKLQPRPEDATVQGHWEVRRAHSHESKDMRRASPRSRRRLPWPWRRAAPWRSSGRAGRTVGARSRLGQDVRPGGHHGPGGNPNLVDFSMPPSVQKQLLAKGGCGHVQDTRRGPEEQVVRDTQDQKMLLDIYRGETRWTPPVVCTASKDDWSWAATCKLGGVSPLADAGALQDFLFKPSAAVLKRIGAILASSPRPCDLGIHLIAADRTNEWGTKKGDESWMRAVAEAIATQETFVADGKQLDFALFVAADRGSTRTKSLLQDAFDDAVLHGRHGAPGRTTVEGNAGLPEKLSTLQLCRHLPHGRDSAFRSIAAARGVRADCGRRTGAGCQRGQHVAASGARGATFWSPWLTELSNPTRGRRVTVSDKLRQRGATMPRSAGPRVE